MTRTGDPDTDAPRLRALADGCGLDDRQRDELPALIVAHTRGMYDGPAADYVERHLHVWRTALG
jgi:hypothetical protein